MELQFNEKKKFLLICINLNILVSLIKLPNMNNNNNTIMTKKKYILEMYTIESRDTSSHYAQL